MVLFWENSLGKTTSLETGRTVYAQVPCALPIIDCEERRVFSALNAIMLKEELTVNTYFNYKFHLKSCKKKSWKIGRTMSGSISPVHG